MRTIQYDNTAYIYIDESGTSEINLSKNGVAQYIVYSAVIINKDNMEHARNILKDIIKKNNIQQGYIKSSKIKNENKRIALLTELDRLEHYVIALVIDKSKIDKDSGLQYKKSFVKYFQRLLSSKFFERYSEFHITFDKYGWPDFQNSLSNYLQEKGYIGNTLFYNNSFMMADDIKEEPLLQIADLYAGTIWKYYCDKYANPLIAKQINERFISKRVSVEWFPMETITYIAAGNLFSDLFNEELYNLSLDTAKRYIEKNENKDPEGTEMLKYLIQESRLSPLKVISSKEIKRKLYTLGYEIGDPIQKISSLRDEEVIIVSPQGKKGYKFPTSVKDLADFYDRLRQNVVPQLKRCLIINNVLQEKSSGKYGVLNNDEYKLLKKLCGIVNDYNHT